MYPFPYRVAALGTRSTMVADEPEYRAAIEDFAPCGIPIRQDGQQQEWMNF
jgi:hypothetical protein